MKQLLLTLMLLAMCSPAWGATYYVSPTGSGSTCSLETPCGLISVGVGKLSTNDSLYIAGGTYSEGAVTITLPSHDGEKIIGSYDGIQTTLDCSTGGLSNIHMTGGGATNYDISGIKFQGAVNSSDLQLVAGISGNIHDCIFQDFASAVKVSSGNTNNIYKNTIAGSPYTTGLSLYIKSSATANVYENKFKGSSTNPTIPRVLVTSLSVLNAYNNVGENMQTGWWHINATTSNNIKNNVLLNYGINAQGYFVFTDVAATVNLSNNNGPYGITTSDHFILNTGGATINQADNQNVNPMVTNPMRFGRIVLTLDDYDGCADAINLAATYYNPAGQVINCAAQSALLKHSNSFTAAQLQAYINAGNDFSAHSYSHPYLTSLAGPTITGPTSTSTVTITTDTTAASPPNWTGTMTLKDGATTLDTINFNVTQGGTVKVNNGDLVTYLNGKNYPSQGAGTWSVSYPTTSGQYSNLTMLTPIADQNVASATVFNFEQRAFDAWEIAYAVTYDTAWIRSGESGRAASYNIRWFVNPSNMTNTVVADKQATAGAYGARGGTVVDYTHFNSLGAFTPYLIYYYPDSNFRKEGGGYLGTSNVSFSSAKTIVITGTTSTFFAAGDTLIVQFSANNNKTVTVASVTTGSGNTTITVNENLIDENNTSAEILCQAKWKSNVYALAQYVESTGQFVEIMSHGSLSTPGSTREGISYLEHQWLSSALSEFRYANLKSGINAILETMWGLGIAPNGNRWSVGAGSISTPDHTLRFDVTYTDQADYHLIPTSPAIGAGVAIAGIHYQATPATDADGKIVHFLPPSIGAYEAQGSTKTITSDFSPTGYAVRGTDAEPALILPGVDGLLIDLSGLATDEAINVKPAKKIKGFTAKGTKQTITRGSGGGGGHIGL